MEVEAFVVVSELKLVLRLMSAVVAVVVVVEAKLRLWRSSVRSSSHGSIALGREKKMGTKWKWFS